MIDEANQSLEESGTPSHEIMVIVLHREFTAGSIGITLAGGADYENKEITVRFFFVSFFSLIFFTFFFFCYFRFTKSSQELWPIETDEFRKGIVFYLLMAGQPKALLIGKLLAYSR